MHSWFSSYKKRNVLIDHIVDCGMSTVYQVLSTRAYRAKWRAMSVEPLTGMWTIWRLLSRSSEPPCLRTMSMKVCRAIIPRLESMVASMVTILRYSKPLCVPNWLLIIIFASIFQFRRIRPQMNMFGIFWVLGRRTVGQYGKFPSWKAFFLRREPPLELQEK